MADWLGALVGGTLSGLFDTVGSAIQYNQQKKLDKHAFERQVELLKMQQSWAERMSNTAHQREVKDLRAAGLNPILSAMGGNGAFTPSVSASTSTGSSAPSKGHVNFDMDILNTAASIERNREETKLISEQIKTEEKKQSNLDAKTDEVRSELPNKRLKNAPAGYVLDKVNSPAAKAAIGAGVSSAVGAGVAAAAYRAGKRSGRTPVLGSDGQIYLVPGKNSNVPGPKVKPSIGQKIRLKTLKGKNIKVRSRGGAGGGSSGSPSEMFRFNRRDKKYF